MPEAALDMEQRGQEMLSLHQASENVRQQQQGHGKPIISWTDHGYRLVAVGKTVFWDKNWVVFADFLLSFMKHTLGREWGNREKDSSTHPVFRWLLKFKEYSDATPADGKLKSGQMMGFMACWMHLGYALYLIAHHDEIPKPLLKRLRDPVSFMPAYYETTVGAVLAVAGFELSCAETKPSSAPTPEFRAKSKTTGTVYEVEAKRKDRWKAPTSDMTDAAFQRELEGYVRDQVHGASKKKLKNPVYWLELSIPRLTNEADWRTVVTKVEAVLRSAEKEITVGGEPIRPAFVVVTNHTFLANEDITGEPCFAFLQALQIDDYPFGRAMEIEAALEGYDKHRDIFWMMEAWKIARAVPRTFDGTPPELMTRDGKPRRTLRIGDIIETPNMQGDTVTAKVEDIASMDDKAMVALSENGRHWLAEMPLSEGEAKAAKRYTDAVFGKNNASRGLSEDHPFDLYDWLLKANEDLKPEHVARIFEENPTVSHYKDLPLKEARIRIAREQTKGMWIRTEQQRKAKTEESGGGSSG